MKQRTMSTPACYVLFTIAVIILGMGISLCDHALLGTDPFSVLIKGLSMTIAISMSLSNALLCAGQTIVGFFLNRKNVTIATILSLFASSIGIALMDMILPQTSYMLVRVTYMVLGIVVYTFGIALSQYPHCGYSTYDAFIFGLAKLFKTNKYSKLRWVADGANLIVGYLLGGTVGVATVVLLVCAGKLVEFFLGHIENAFGEMSIEPMDECSEESISY